MHGLIAQGYDPGGKLVNLVTELFTSDPNFHSGLDIRSLPAGAELGWIAHDDGTITAYVAPALTKPQLSAYDGNARYLKEIGGITVSSVPISTDDRSKLLITGAYNSAKADGTWTTIWRGSDGNSYPVNAAAVIAIADAVAAHVNACFTAAAANATAIAAGTITTAAQIDAVYAAITT